MGNALTKSTTKPFNHPRLLRQKVRALEEELMDVKSEREHERLAHDHQATIFAAKAMEWKRERKRWKEEVGRLKKKLEDRDERIRLLETEAAAISGKDEKEWQLLGTNLLVEHMREEQLRREEAVEKWKRLYLAIKTELDDLIHRTMAQGERLWWGPEEDEMMESMQRELKGKEELVEALRERLSAMDKEAARKEREVDILRQSLRIMSNNKKAYNPQKKFPKVLNL